MKRGGESRGEGNQREKIKNTNGKFAFYNTKKSKASV